LPILAVETSCDDSAVALLEGTRVLSERIRSQDEHASHGGVVPEIASRLHMSVLPGLVREALEDAGMPLESVGTIAATAGPGLAGSLLVGLSWAKAAAFSLRRRFIAVNHLAAHLFVHYDQENQVAFPAAALVASGGHTSLFLMDSWSSIRFLGGTRDDAAGEAYDKTAKLLGLGYPGGARIDRLAPDGDPGAVPLPLPLPDRRLPEFSFSGLKTAVRMQWERGAKVEDIAASFNSVVAGLLSGKLMYQARRHRVRTVLAAGGVAANSELRRSLESGCRVSGMDLRLPQAGWATDNGVMVGRAAAAILDMDPAAEAPLSCNAFARWSGELLDARAW